MSNTFSFVSLVVKTGFTFLALFLFAMIIHEFAHLIFSILFNVPIISFTWFDPRYFAPILVTEYKENTIALIIIGCSGGIISGGLYLAILFFSRKWLQQSLYRWILGCCLVTVGLWEFSIGILEGSFHYMYVNDAVSSSGISYAIVYFFAIAGIIMYIIALPRPAKINYRHKTKRIPRIIKTHPNPVNIK